MNAGRCSEGLAREQNESLVVHLLSLGTALRAETRLDVLGDDFPLGVGLEHLLDLGEEALVTRACEVTVLGELQHGVVSARLERGADVVKTFGRVLRLQVVEAERVDDRVAVVEADAEVAHVADLCLDVELLFGGESSQCPDLPGILVPGLDPDALAGEVDGVAAFACAHVERHAAAGQLLRQLNDDAFRFAFAVDGHD